MIFVYASYFVALSFLLVLLKCSVRKKRYLQKQIHNTYDA